MFSSLGARRVGWWGHCHGGENGDIGMVRMVGEGLGDGSCSITPALGRGHHLAAGGGQAPHSLCLHIFLYLLFYIIGGRLRTGNKRQKYAGNAPHRKDNSVGGAGREFQKSGVHLVVGDDLISVALKVSWSWERKKGRRNKI